MIVCDKLKKKGITTEIINLIKSKTKHKNIDALEAKLLSVDPYGTICIRIVLPKGERQNVTFHISEKKLKILRRDFILNSVLGN